MLTVTATDLPRLMACNGSRLMGGFTPPVDTDDTVRNEGIAADWLVDQVFNMRFTAEELIDRKAENGVYITAEMVEYLEEYLKAVGTIGFGAQIEVNTSHAGHGWQVNGRADLTKYHAPSQHLDVGDLKFGWGIVEPEDNWTLISHVFGWIAQHPDKPVSSATITIYQPRPHHPGGHVRSVTLGGNMLAELYHRLTTTLSNPSDALNTGPHCYKCPALATCPAARKAQMNAIDASEKAFVDNIDNANLSFQLDHVNRAMEALKQSQKAYSELALHRLRMGQIIPNYSCETGLTNRQWKQDVTPETIQMLTGINVRKPGDMITPNQAEKAGVLPEVVAAFTERRNKDVKLVRIDANTKAKQMFGGKK